MSKSVLITGCSDGGIGSALAMTFQQRGLHVFATARNTQKMSALSGLSNVTLLPLDVVKPADITAAVAAVAKQTGGTLDYLVSNAGRNRFMPILDEDIDAVRDLYEINYFAPMALTHAFAPLLIKARGMAVYITSTSGYLNIPYMGTYAGSKRSLELMAEALRLELAPLGVDVLSVVTGAVKSLGQTYFGDVKLPEASLYKSIEDTFIGRAQGHDSVQRMDTMEYAAAVVDDVVARKTGRVWHGGMSGQVKMSTTATVPQDVMDAGAITGTGIDVLSRK